MISINYNRAYQEANRLKSVANECENLINQNNRYCANIHSYWEGMASNEFVEANEKWRREMLSIKQELNTVSRLIKKVADEIKEADRRAAEAAKNL